MCDVLYKKLLTAKLYLKLYDEANRVVKKKLDEHNVLKNLITAKHNLTLYEKDFKGIDTELSIREINFMDIEELFSDANKHA